MKPSHWPESPDDRTEDRISLPPLPQAVRESAARALNEPRFRMHAAASQAEAAPQAVTLPPTAPASPPEPEAAAAADAASPMRTAPRKRPAMMLAAVSLAVAVGAVLFTALGTGPSTEVNASAAGTASTAAHASEMRAHPAPVIDERVRIGQALRGWAAAWSAKDLDRYFASYASEFRPPDGKSLESWRELRKQRILGKKQIGIAIDDISVEMLSDARAMARFAQTYAADGYSEVRAPKMMILAREGSAWRIAEELADKPRR